GALVVGVVGDLDLAQVTFLAVDVVGAALHIAKDTAVLHSGYTSFFGRVSWPAGVVCPGRGRFNHAAVPAPACRIYARGSAPARTLRPGSGRSRPGAKPRFPPGRICAPAPPAP